MGSSRLPGKILMPLRGKPMLALIVERLKASRRPETVIVATSSAPRDSAAAALAESLGVPVFRGSELDVLDRYYRCAAEHGLSTIVRATADNPFVDPEECDRLLELHETGVFDYACAFPEFGSGLPVGVGLEVFTFAALERSWREATSAAHREHVNEYIQENPSLFKIGVLIAPAGKTAPSLRLTVDTAEDLTRAQELYERYDREAPGQPVPVSWVIGAAR